MFNRAKEVIAVHGSGLANIIFCKANTQILEIDSIEGHKGPYSGISKVMKLNYEHFTTDGNNLSKNEKARGDVFVNIEKLKRVIDQKDSVKKKN